MTPLLTIPPEWREAVDAAPGDFTVRSALCDWLADRDFDNECLRWSTEKSRSPFRYSDGGWRWPQMEKFFAEAALPWELFRLLPPRRQELLAASGAFDRLLQGWAAGKKRQKRQWWKWQQPPSRPE